MQALFDGDYERVVRGMKRIKCFSDNAAEWKTGTPRLSYHKMWDYLSASVEDISLLVSNEH
jgi:hypothetical protein